MANKEKDLSKKTTTEQAEQTQQTATDQDLKKLLNSLEALQLENDELKSKLLRAQADFDNYRKRTTQEKSDIALYANGQLISELLPAWDNFERAIVASNEHTGCEALADGIEIVFRQFMETLTASGLAEIEAAGTTFDPEYHRAVMQVDGGKPGTVAEVIQKGYTFKGRVIRPSMVSVYK